MPHGEDPDPLRGGAASLADLGERGLIARLRRRLPAPGPEVLVGIGDDAAAVAWSGATLLLTTDTLIEDIHFRRATASLREVGAKAMAVNVSDIAAMGGEPRFALLAVALPPRLGVSEADELFAGLEEVAARHRVAVLGGDTCAGPDRIVLTVTLLGAVDGPPLRRSGARAGDLVLVTGHLGAAAAGLQLLERGTLAVLPEQRAVVERAHRSPTPRVAEGRVIRASGLATAMIDLSDGLATDLGHIATESGVGATVTLAALPIDPATAAVARAARADPRHWALSGGEDYELLFTASPAGAATLARRVPAETGTPVRVIGEMVAGAGVRFLDEAGGALAVAPGFDHFAPRSA